MRVVITGGSGLIGSELRSRLTEQGHDVLVMVRRAPRRPGEIRWNPAGRTIDTTSLSELDAAVHLAGASIAGRRWDKARKAEIRESRVAGTGVLCEALARLAKPPRVLVAASAIGFYGHRGSEVLTETSHAGTGFLADVTRAWEAATAPARDAGIRVVNLRIGIVLSSKGGALAQMLLPFRMGVGGVLGSGDQIMSWITLDDVVRAIDHAIKDETLSGPVNAVAPAAVDNRTFTKTLGRVLRRPTFFHVPAFMVRLLFGEMGDQLLLSSTHAVPTRLEASGFRFHHGDLESALRDLMADA